MKEPGTGFALKPNIPRGMFSRGTTAARSASSINIVRPQRRDFVASMANVSMQVPRSFSPVLTGFPFAAGDLALPFLAGTAFQGADIADHWSFGQMEPGFARVRRSGSPGVTA